MVQDALRGVVRKVMREVADGGLPGEHHFYIAFDTTAPGVRMSSRLRQQHPQEMTVVLQHQFWDLAVTDHGFEVGLSFGGVPERLLVPFAAVKGFFDPSVQFGLQFDPSNNGEQTEETAEHASVADGEASPIPSLPTRAAEPGEAATGEAPAGEDGEAEPDENAPNSGAEVVSLDAFRKKT
nr:ClpXP protease specificity-enhancing factor SspB [Acuticoccus kalidii]